MGRFLLITFSLAIAACAAPVSEPNRDETVQLSESAQAEKSHEEDLLAQSNSKESIGVIDETKAPKVDKTPASMIPGRAEPELAIVCERVVPTGSVLPVRVCRHQSEINRKQAADEKIVDDIKRNTAIGASRL